MDRRARGGARARGAALGPALARPGDRALRGALRGGGRRALRGRGLERHGGPPPVRPDRRRRGGRRGDHDAVLVRGERELLHLRRRDAGLRGHRPADAEPRSRRCRGRDHTAHEGDRRGRHLRVPLRARPAAGALRAARPRADPGRVRGPRRALPRPAGRFGRASRRVRLLPEQADHDRRGRHRRHRVRGGVAPAEEPAQPGPGGRWPAGSSTRGSASTIGSTTCAAAIGVAQLEKLERISTLRDEVARRYSSLLAPIDGVETPPLGDAEHERSWFVYVVKSEMASTATE